MLCILKIKAWLRLLFRSMLDISVLAVLMLSHRLPGHPNLWKRTIERQSRKSTHIFTVGLLDINLAKLNL